MWACGLLEGRMEAAAAEATHQVNHGGRGGVELAHGGWRQGLGLHPGDVQTTLEAATAAGGALGWGCG